MTKRTRWMVGLIVFAAAFVYFASYIEYGISYDEGYLLDGVERIMEGQVIYRDFHHTYAPGRFYVVAAAFEIFGKNILVERFVFVFLQALKCALAFLIVATITGSWFALLAPVLIMIAPGPWHKVFFSSPGFLATYTMILSIRKTPRWLLLAGAIVGMCAVFRQDTAAFAAIGGLIGMAIHVFARSAASRPASGGAPVTLPQQWQRYGVLVAHFACGIATVVVPVLLYFHAKGALGAMIHKMSVDGMIDNMTNRIPYPGLSARMDVDSQYLRYVLPVRLLFYVPFVAYGLSLLVIVRRAVLRSWSPTLTSFVVLLSVCVLAFNQSIWRSDLGHLLQTMQFALLLVAILISFALSALQRKWSGRNALMFGLRLVLILLAPALLVWASVGVVAATADRTLFLRFLQERVSVVGVQYLGSAAVRAGKTTKLSLQRVPVYVSPGKARFFEALGEYLDAHTKPGDYVLAIPQLQILYFYYDRRNPTAYAHYRRALDPEEEEKYIEDIRSHQTEYIFLTEPFKGAKMGTKQSFSEYARRVRNWIFDNYEVVDGIGTVKILRRKT